MAPKSKAASAAPSASEKLCKAAKDDEVKRCAEALDKGADINWVNDKGHAAVHVAAAFGALNVLVWLHRNGADFTLQNDKKLTPVEVARKIGEDEAVELIEALNAGKSAAEIDALLQASVELPVETELRDVSYKPKAPTSQPEVEVLAPVEPSPPPPHTAKAVPAKERPSPMIDDKPDPSALLWSDVHGHGRNTEGAATKAGALTVLSSPGIECWVLGLGEDTMRAGDAFAYRITFSRFDTADAMLLGVADAAAGSAAESGRARSAFYNPRAGEVWLMEKNKVLQRVPLDPATFRLFGKAAGSEVIVRVVAGGGLALKVDGADEVVVPAGLPEHVRPCARLGKVGDTVALRKVGKSGRSERTSNDSVISMPA